MLSCIIALRSVIFALTAAVMNLLSVAAAYGVTAFFLDGGWAGGPVGVEQPVPIGA